VLLYFSNSMKTLSTLCLLDHKNEDKDIIKLKIIYRLEVIQDFKYCCNVKRYTDVKKRAMSHAVNAVNTSGKAGAQIPQPPPWEMIHPPGGDNAVCM
jgi:hypothetical protein